MPEAKDTLLRLFSLLRLIPEYPRYSTAPTLHEKLRDRGFYVDLRTVQRDLQRLSGPFSLIDEEEGGRKQWSHAKNAPLDLRDMEPATALALYLAEGHLKNLLPQSVLDLLDPQFNKARNYLLGVSAPIGAGKLLASWVRNDLRGGNLTDADQYAVGYTHGLSKRTDLYTSFARTNVDVGADVNIFNVGMRHKF